MVNVWCVRAEFGTYTPHFVRGGYIAIGWEELGDLSKVRTREQLYEMYRESYPKDSNIVTGQQVGQINRFVLEMKAGDYVITPDANTDLLHYGRLTEESTNYQFKGDDGCPYNHRRHIEWAKITLNRSAFSVPFQNTIRSSLTVFAISQIEEFLHVIGQARHPTKQQYEYDAYAVVLEQVLELDAKEFEILVSHLLTALGFEGSEVVGRTGDGGVDATGELNVSNLAKVKIFVQAKRYKIGSKITGATVRALRQAIPFGGQGAFITTADFQTGASEVALEQGFPRIGLINGRQLVDLLIEHWADIPEEFRLRLRLKPGLVRI